VSGGGGWGPKEGLLSLDPQTSYDIPSEARFDFSSGTLEEAQASALGNIVQAGGSIQFFAALHPTSDHLPQKSTRKNALTFGAVPSKADEFGLPPNGDESELEGENLSFLWDQFGCVSESGMFLQYRGEASQKWLANTTKVDLPYSVVGRYAMPLSQEITHSTDANSEALLLSKNAKITS
jgi:hypothetical protein